ncbi:hypothetical protein [Polaromonas sp.]|uniref:hypothetical protein n=1 Tax=Polaromonas sp. TaxID=1869339 RepID=UPI0032672F16
MPDLAVYKPRTGIGVDKRLQRRGHWPGQIGSRLTETQKTFTIMNVMQFRPPFVHDREQPQPGLHLLTMPRRICGVADPRAVIERIAQGMAQAQSKCSTDARISPQVQAQVSSAWAPGLVLAKEIARGTGANSLSPPPR